MIELQRDQLQTTLESPSTSKVRLDLAAAGGGTRDLDCESPCGLFLREFMFRWPLVAYDQIASVTLLVLVASADGDDELACGFGRANITDP